MKNMEKLEKELKSLALQTIADCTLTKETSYFGKTEKCGILLPSGDEKYFSFWVRDAAMMAQSGLVESADLKRYIEIIATCGQNGSQTSCLAHGLQVPPYALATISITTESPSFIPAHMQPVTTRATVLMVFSHPSVITIISLRWSVLM